MEAHKKKTLGQAIDEIVAALEALDDTARATAVHAACEHLGLSGVHAPNVNQQESTLAMPPESLEQDASGPTMRQKVRHILKKRGIGKTAMQSPEAATQAVDEIVGTFVRGVYTRSSVSTHTPTDRNEILRIRDWVRVALCELLEVRVGA